MPRKSRIDAPGALHHVIIRGIERRKIFRSDYDRQNFLNRLSELLPETHTDCFAWALIPNHVHLLLRTGLVPISIIMNRLLTGYGGSFEQKYELKASGYDFDHAAKRVAEVFGMTVDDVMAFGKSPGTVKARALLCYWAHRKLGMTTVEIAGKLNLCQSAEKGAPPLAQLFVIQAI